MELHTRQTATAEYWRQMQADRRLWGDSSPMHAVLERLLLLGREPTSDEMDAVLAEIYGNAPTPYSATGHKCNECGAVVDAVVRAGEPLDWETRTADLCRRCVLTAAALISDRPTGNVFADWLEEHGHKEAAIALRKAFPLAEGD